MTRKELEQAYSSAQAKASALEVERDHLARTNQQLLEELRHLRSNFFGRRSERLHEDQRELFEGGKSSAPESSTPGSRTSKGKGHGRQLFPEHLPRETEERKLPPEELSCDECGAELRPIGDEVTERGHIIPAKMLVKRYVREKRACPQGHQVKTAALPGSLVDRCKYEPSVYAWLAVAKYADHQPLHRLEGILKRHRCHLPRSTMWDMLSRLEEVVAGPIFEEMRRQLLEGTHLQSDDTPVTVRPEKGKGSKKGYIWHYGWGQRRMFDFTLSRSRDGPASFLGTWKGTLQTDGYPGYDHVVARNDLRRVGCWAHARRKVHDAVEAKDPAAGPLLDLIQRLFRVEALLRLRIEREELGEDQARTLILAVRQRTSRRILDRIRQTQKDLDQSPAVLPRGLLGKALTYLDRQWPTLIAFLDDPLVAIHNNDAERSIRHLALGRKNWIFFGSPRGGDVCGKLISLVHTCKLVDVDPEAYLEHAIRAIDITPASQIHQLTPWAYSDHDAVNSVSD